MKILHQNLLHVNAVCKEIIMHLCFIYLNWYNTKKVELVSWLYKKLNVICYAYVARIEYDI